MSSRWRLCFLTLFFTGKFPFISGTIGSAVAVFLALPVLYFSHNTLFLLAILVLAVAIREIDLYEKEGGKHDDKRIVIDELVGQWVALSFVSFTLIQIVAAFVFFRIFDIWKPSLIGYVDAKVKGGWGVMGDDALAGIVAGLSVASLAKIYYFLF